MCLTVEVWQGFTGRVRFKVQCARFGAQGLGFRVYCLGEPIGYCVVDAWSGIHEKQQRCFLFCGSALVQL